jgi:hypothetical protein
MNSSLTDKTWFQSLHSKRTSTDLKKRPGIKYSKLVFEPAL